MRMKSKKLYLEVVGIMLIISLIIGISYSYYYANVKDVNKTETHLKAQAMGLTYTGETEINCGSMVPGNTCVKTFKVENTSDVKVYYNIYMENITNEFNEDLVYTLTDDEGTVVSETVLPKTKTGKEYLKKSIVIDASPAVKNYTLTIKYKYTEENQNEYQGASFRATVGIDAEQTGDLYKLTGTVVKLLDGGETETVTSGNLVFFSEKQDIEIQSDGTFEATDLEVGNHEVYYMGDIDASAMNKDEVRANALCKMTTFNILTTTKVTLTCKDGVDPVGLKDIVPTPQSSSNKLICKRATELHTDTCEGEDWNSYGCVSLGYSQGDTIEFGKLGTSGTLASGDAFDCDINGDGTFDSETERFYYVSPLYTGGTTDNETWNNNIAVLIYYNNVSGGVPNNTTAYAYDSNVYEMNEEFGDTLNGPRTALGQLPTTTQWKNVKLSNNVRIIRDEWGQGRGFWNEETEDYTWRYLSFSYTGSATRLLTIQEVEKSCNVKVNEGRIENLGDSTCLYLMENTAFNLKFNDYGGLVYLSGYWLETFSGYALGPYQKFYINSGWTVGSTAGDDENGFGIRPVIEVPVSNIQY